jgi:hypothetical protein
VVVKEVQQLRRTAEQRVLMSRLYKRDLTRSPSRLSGGSKDKPFFENGGKGSTTAAKNSRTARVDVQTVQAGSNTISSPASRKESYFMNGKVGKTMKRVYGYDHVKLGKEENVNKGVDVFACA